MSTSSENALAPCAFGIEQDESGLKTGGDLRVPIVVLDLQEAEASTGFDEGIILREVELRLLRHGIVPADRATAHALGWYLGIDILIVGSAYHVKASTPRYGCIFGAIMSDFRVRSDIQGNGQV